MVTSQTHTLKVHEEKEFYLEDLLLLDAMDMMVSAEPINARIGKAASALSIS